MNDIPGPDQEIRVSTGGAEYTYPRTITEINGKNISTSVVQVALGTYDDPGGDWLPPHILDWVDTHTAVVQVLIGEGGTIPEPGTYYLHTRVGDTPEDVQRRSPGRIVIR